MNSQLSEIKLDPKKCVISTTDKKGYIKHCNDYFTELSGFKKEQLIGSPHNIIRHPDMPKEAFNSLWSTVSKGQSWMGIVKNKSANGNYYWVDAYVTPLYENGIITGYQSVRHKADQYDIDRANSLYNSVNGNTNSFSIPKLKSRTLITTLQGLSVVLPATIACGLAIGLSMPSMMVLLCSVFFSVVIAGFIQSAQYRRLGEKSRKIFSDTMAQQVYSSFRDEVGEVDLALHFMNRSMKTVLNRLEDASEKMYDHTKGVFSEVHHVSEEAAHQLRELESAATGVDQISVAIQEVAESCDHAANAAKQTDKICREGMELIKKSEGAITALSGNMQQSAFLLRELHKKTENIDQVVQVISGIAEQTNLLALNAAIEAARAGEAGRGFAVVADEVRSLASSSQQSTESIHVILSEFRNETHNLVEVMSICESQADSTTKDTIEAEQAFKQLQEVISSLSSMNTQIAAATEEQSVTAIEMKQRMQEVFNSSHAVSSAAQHTHNISNGLLSEAEDLSGLIKRFSSIAS